MASTPTNWINTMVSRLPYNYRPLQNLLELNPKFETFSKITAARDEVLAKQAVFSQMPDDGAVTGGIVINKDYSNFIYAQIDLDKTNRIREYRRMATSQELSDCIDEICDEAIVKDENSKIAKFTLRGKHKEIIKEEIEKEFDSFINIFNLEDKGWEILRNFLIDGELFWENVIVDGKENLGILGLVSIPTELINPVYDNVQNSIIKGYILRKPKVETKRPVKSTVEETLIPLAKNQVTYINSGIWNEDKTIRLPYIEAARRAYKQLTLIEDSIVIYRLVRAPERLVFKIDTGNMPPPKAEAYLRRLMQQYWTKKGFDSSTNRVTNIYDPQSMLDSYWFPKRTGSDGSSVESLPAGANLGELADLNYFVMKLYKALKVPIGRLNPEEPFKDGNEITREELRFARFVIRIQRNFSVGVRTTFINHLKLKGLWSNYKLKEHHIQVDFNVPTAFMAMRQQQLLELRYNNFNAISQNEGVANSYCQKHYLELSDAQMAENREWLKKDAAFQWELEQIKAGGPNWRENAQQIAGAMGGEGGAGGAPMGGSTAGGPPPDFGAPPPGGGEAGAEAGGAEAGAEGGAAAAPTGGSTTGGTALPGAPPT